MPAVGAEELGQEAPACRVAVRHYDDAQGDLNVYRVMLQAFSAVLLGFLILAIVLFVAGKSTSGLVSLVGTVSTSGGALFVLKQRNAAKRASDEAVSVVTKLCATPVTEKLTS